jgi:toxin ParE1/3/4
VKRHEILLTAGAEQDLEDLYFNLLERVSRERADELLDQILKAAESLSAFPDRGACPQELAWLGIREFRQIQVAHYRIVYRRIENQVFILVIADGRQDMQSLLERRLLDA